MTVYVVVLEDHCDDSECFAFSTKEKAAEFAREQRSLDTWLRVDEYESVAMNDTSRAGS
jgi:hypothetical protein